MARGAIELPGARFEGGGCMPPHGSSVEVVRSADAADASKPPSLSVLVVEDNDYNVDVAKQMLEFLGHTVTVAFNGKEAVDIVVTRDRAGTVTPGGGSIQRSTTGAKSSWMRNRRSSSGPPVGA